MSGERSAVWSNAQLATMADVTADHYGVIDDGAIAVEDGLIAWVGSRAALPASYRNAEHHDCNGAWITPGLIDCHTHLVYAGDRAAEFEQRLLGASYEDIARAGGGIQSTVKATRAASEDELLRQSAKRLAALLAEGVTTIEIKSGYGLDLISERKILRVARKLAGLASVEVKTTFLGAHALPPEFAGRADDYISEVCEHMLPAVAAEALADAVDAFCENIAFTPQQTARVFDAAQRHGLPVKLHADQLSDSGGALLAARYRAQSADHLERASAASLRAMANAGTVAVLLPGAYYFLRDTHLPPIAALREQRVPIAIATDCNPGTSPCTSLLLMLNMGCTLFRMTPAEALAGVTRNAALALGLRDRGQLRAGMRADFVLWDIGHPAELAYAFGANPCVGQVFAGVARVKPGALPAPEQPRVSPGLRR
jgi:imidazolonepropionase